MVFQDVATRLAASLLGLAQGKAPRRLDITQAALGQLVGASREIVNKRLRALAAQGIVALSPGRILLLDEARLTQMIPVRVAGA
jgi:CRP-like cAMP-binding protein